MKPSFYCLMLTTSFLLSGCIFDDSNANLTKEQAETLAAVKGIDDNKNGIRDDVDAYIERYYNDESHRKSVEQYARALQNELVIDNNDKEALSAASNASTMAISCIFERIPTEAASANGSVIHGILGITLNTQPRISAYQDYSNAAKNVVLSLPDNPSCD